MPRLSRRSAGILLAVVVIAVAGAAATVASHGPSAQEDRAAQVSRATPDELRVSDRATGRPVPAGFLGLSLEYTAIEPYAGTDPKKVNPVFAQLVRNLSPNQSPVLRIGGDSTDWAWWPVPGATKPRGVRVTLDDRWLHVTAALTHELGAKLILGIDLEMDSSTDAAAEANAFVDGIGRGSIVALEPGNEPELYGSFTWYVTPAGVHVKGRPAGYDFADYLSDFTRTGNALPHGIPLAGPATGGPHWIPKLGSFLPAEPRVKLATLHRYPLQQCFVPTSSPQYPSVAHILAPSASQGLADSVAPYVGIAHSRHVTLRIDEMNTDSCGAVPSVDHAFASALWALDASFQMARVGVDGINLHSYPTAPYSLFTFKRVHGKWQGSVSPEYYGLEMFAQAAPPGARLLSLSGSLGNVRTWATRAPDGTVHVVLINEDTARSRAVTVRIAGGQLPATLERLRGNSVSAATGVTIGGQSFGRTTETGTLRGRSTNTSVRPTNGAYALRLPPASAAMLTLAAPAPA
jgi:Glycosyl hydrolase family 79 C-terminal beta domain/Glycosyl hydrolase family 30 beta sandwich domain